MTDSLRHMEQPVKTQGDSPTGPARHEARPDEPEYLLHHGIWHCFVRGSVIHAGLGYDQLAAYEDWKRMQEKYAA